MPLAHSGDEGNLLLGASSCRRAHAHHPGDQQRKIFASLVSVAPALPAAVTVMMVPVTMEPGASINAKADHRRRVVDRSAIVGISAIRHGDASGERPALRWPPRSDLSCSLLESVVSARVGSDHGSRSACEEKCKDL